MIFLWCGTGAEQGQFCVGTERDIDTGMSQVAPSRYPDDATWETAAAYLSSVYRANPKLNLLAGLRYNYVWLNADIDNSFYDFPFDRINQATGAMTASLGYNWLINSSTQMTGNLATGFRAANLDDSGKIFDSEPGLVVVPNPDLRPEFAYSIDFGFQKKWEDRFIVKGSIFGTLLDNALARDRFTFNGQSQINYQGALSDVQAIQNASQQLVYGVEANAKLKLNKSIELQGNINVTKGKESLNGDTHPVRHVPPTFGDLRLNYTRDKYQLSLSARFNDSLGFNDLAPSEQNKSYLSCIGWCG